MGERPYMCVVVGCCRGLLGWLGEGWLRDGS